MIDPFDALKIICEESEKTGTEMVSIFNALNRVVAKKVQSDRSLPPKDNSAMDGYALKHEDIKSVPVTLKVKGVIKAGDNIDSLNVEKGECYRIMTGAFVPEGADTVVEFESTEEEGDKKVKIVNEKKKGANIRKKGEDINKGDFIDMSGFKLNAYRQARLVSTGTSMVCVYKKPRVAIIATGDELEYPSGGCSEEKIIDSNSVFVKSTLESMGIYAEYIGIAKDNVEDLANMFSGLDNYDIVITSAGISFGDYDVMTNAASIMGINWLFTTVNQKPGKPFSFGKRDDTLIFSLPGNPVSSAFCTYFYIQPALRKMTGCNKYHNKYINAELRGSFKKRNNRVHFNRVNILYDNNNFYAVPYDSQDSHMISSLAVSNGFLVIDADKKGEVKTGSKHRVYIYDFESVF